MNETKGQTTKHHILREGLMLASVKGLVNISIGGLAAKAEMSRSGLFAHFLSKEQLQLEILEFANGIFNELVMVPCQKIDSPLERLKFLMSEVPSWYEKTEPQIPGGCIFLTACSEFDDRPGQVKDYLLTMQMQFLDFLKDTHHEAVKSGEFKGGMTDDNFAFVFYSFHMGFNQYKKFFGNENARKYIDFNYSGLLEYAIQTPPVETVLQNS